MTQLRNMNITGIDGTVSTVNSSTTVLDPGGTNVFTGTSEEITGYGVIYVTVKADVASATDGLSVQQSSDGTNWDHTDEFTVPAATGKTYSFQAAAKYFRIVYTNGAVIQTYFRLQVLFKAVNGKPSSHRVQDSITSDDDAELVKAVLTALRDDGVYTNIGSTNSNNLKVAVAEAAGVPTEYSKLTETGNNFIMQKGQLNKFRIRPQVINEHAESSQNAQSTVTSTNIVGQVFKASQDNINSICLTLESAGGVTGIDDFDAYANDAALQAVWVETGADPALLETTIVKSGKSMALDFSGSVGDEWQDTIAPVDKTGGSVELDLYQTHAFSTQKTAVFIGDGTNTKSFQLVSPSTAAWFHYDVDFSLFAEDGGGTTDESAITEIGFRIDDRRNASWSYIDDVSIKSSPGNVELKLWDMGATLPTSGADLLTGQYTTLGDIGAGQTAAASVQFALSGGKKLYKVHDFVAGAAKEMPANVLMTSGNYYAITLHYVDDDITVYGPNESYSIQYYTNGYAFTTPNEATAITSLGTYNDLMFIVFSTQDVYITEVDVKFDAVPNGGASFSMFVEDSNMSIVDIPTDGEMLFGQTHEEDMSSRPAFLEQGGKMECYYNDGGTDSVTQARFEMKYFYVPPTVNG